MIAKHNSPTSDVDAELPNLLARARRLTLSSQDAHDLVQDALVRALPALGKVAPGSNLRAWLMTIMRHVHIDRLRRVAREPPAVSIEEMKIESLALADQVAEPANAMDFEDLQEALDEALDALPESFRRVLVLHELEGRSYREISAVLGIPLATVGTRLSRARLKLRMLLAYQSGRDVPAMAGTRKRPRPAGRR